MSLQYQGQMVHDAGCSCCTDASTSPSRIDPAGASSLRLGLRSAMRMKLNRMRQILKDQLITNDLLGLRMNSISSSMMGSIAVAGGATKVQVFQSVVDDALKNTFLGADGSYIRPFIDKAYAKGLKFANRKTKSVGNLHGHDNERDRISTLASMTFVEMQGIAEAVSQQIVRIAADGILTKKPPIKMLKAMYVRLEKVGVSRIKALADFAVTRVFNEAALDAYESAGFSSVGLIPERRRSPKALDAASFRDARRRGSGAGSRISRTVVPSRTTVSRILKQQAAVEALGKVNIVTAGDDDVCPTCERLAAVGPYSINAGRSLIPAHPYCRCVFVPAGDRRFASSR